MTFEANSPPGQTIELVNANQIRATLIAAGIEKYPDPLVADLLQELELNGSINLDVDSVVAGARSVLTIHETSVATEFKDDLRERVVSGYPQSVNQDAESVESPRQYARSNKLNHRRTELGIAYKTEVDDSRASLLDLLDSDNYVTSEVNIEADQLSHSVSAQAEQLRSEISDLVSQVKSLLPKKRLAFLGGFLVGKSKKVANEPTVETVSPLHDTIEALLDLLNDASNAGTSMDFATEVAGTFYEQVDATITADLDDHYGDITRPAISLLKRNIKTAYETVADEDKKAASLKVAAATEDPVLLDSGIDLSGLHRGEAEPDEDEAEVQVEVNVGDFDSPFPWLDSDTVHLSYVQGDQPFLYCTAFPTRSGRISRRLREQPRTARRLDQITDRMKAIEASGNASASRPISLLRGPEFHNLTICLFGVAEPNAPRLYYATTRLARFPELSAQLKDRYGADTSLIILLAEVDKHNELKVYDELGIGRRHARAYGAGSI